MSKDHFLDKPTWFVDEVFTVVKPDQHPCEVTKSAVNINSHFGQERVLGLASYHYMCPKSLPDRQLRFGYPSQSWTWGEISIHSSFPQH